MRPVGGGFKTFRYTNPETTSHNNQAYFSDDVLDYAAYLARLRRSEPIFLFTRPLD